jgi:2-phospho-L-lactate/phosphoenolpyruvate guanylyltransferase
VPTAAILPVKSFAQAKQRLGASLADPLRLTLARAMVADVLAALSQASSIERTIVVTREPDVSRAALAGGAIVIPDAGERGQSVAAALGVACAMAEGFDRVLCVPGDCPALHPAELERMLAGHDSDRDGVVVLPDRHGTGTNGLLLCPPDAIEPSFGPDSCERHVALARAAGHGCRVERLGSLLLDIDTGADLAVLRERLGELGERARATRAVLAGPEFATGAAVAAHA